MTDPNPPTDQEIITEAEDAFFALEEAVRATGDASLIALAETAHAKLLAARTAFSERYAEGGIAQRSGGGGKPPSDPNP